MQITWLWGKRQHKSLKYICFSCQTTKSSPSKCNTYNQIKYHSKCFVVRQKFRPPSVKTLRYLLNFIAQLEFWCKCNKIAYLRTNWHLRIYLCISVLQERKRLVAVWLLFLCTPGMHWNFLYSNDMWDATPKEGKSPHSIEWTPKTGM